MEDNTNKDVVQTTTNDANVDYKALYEEQQVAYNSLKNSFDRTSSEVANLKKAQRESLTKEEQAKADAEEREKYYKAIERENNFIKTKAELSKTISDDKLLDKVSNSFIDGDILGGIKAINSYVSDLKSNYEKQITSVKMTNNPTPPATNSDNSTTLTKDAYRKMSLAEKAKLAQTDPDTYKKFNS